jgi:hypothetical protein
MSKSSRENRSFVEQYLAGTVTAEHIDDFMDAWHDRPENKKKNTLSGCANPILFRK